MRARFGFSELVGRSSPNDVATELDEQTQHLDELEYLRAVVDDREKDDPEARLERRMFVKIVEDDLTDFAALQVDDDPHAVTV